MMDIKTRLIEVCNVKNIRQVDLQNEGGGSRPTISAAFTGRQKPNLDIIAALLKLVPGLNARWLITGDGKMFDESDLIEKESYNAKVAAEESAHSNGTINIQNIRKQVNTLIDEYERISNENKELKNKIR